MTALSSFFAAGEGTLLVGPDRTVSTKIGGHPVSVDRLETSNGNDGDQEDGDHRERTQETSINNTQIKQRKHETYK